jgi:hypothetical protein
LKSERSASLAHRQALNPSMMRPVCELLWKGTARLALDGDNKVWQTYVSQTSAANTR